MSVSLILPNRKRPAELVVACALAYVQALLALATGTVLLARLRDADFAEQYNINNVVSVLAVVYLIAGLLVLVMATGVLFGIKMMRLLLGIALAIDIVISTISLFRGGVLVLSGLFHVFAALLIIWFLYVPASRRYFSREAYRSR